MIRYKTNLIFLLVSLVFSLHASAQIDKSGGGIVIPKGDTGTTASPEGTDSQSAFSTQGESKSIYKGPKLEVGEQKSNFSMMQNDEFVNRSSEFVKRATVNRGGESNEAYRGNQFLGEFKTKSKFVQVMARDFGLEDGDRVKVLVNDKIIISDLMLTNDFKGIQLTLAPGFNKVEFEALNQGTTGPNTAEFRIYDDQEKLVSSNQWNLATGFKASVMIIKEDDSKE